MKKQVLSSPHGLTLIPVSGVIRFARINSRTVLTVLGEKLDAFEIPGSIKTGNTIESGVFKKTISYERRGGSPLIADELEQLRHTRLVAVYMDEYGDRRVAGSPTYPLSLEYSSTEGGYAVTLTGEDTAADSYLMD